jgi:hypothetical protein
MIGSLVQGEQTTGYYRYDYTLDKPQRLDHESGGGAYFRFGHSLLSSF